MPYRIQRRRTKGWRMPEGAIYVGRPGIWGNPYSGFYHLETALMLYRNTLLGYWNPKVCENDAYNCPGLAYTLHREMWERFMPWHFQPRQALYLLGGKNLACWCPLDKPCHGDILLELANEGE